MRRFSQRHPLVTLSDINVTPLLDLAFVLLIIFIITSPLLEQGLELELPEGGDPDRQINQENIQTVEVGPNGEYLLNGESAALPTIEEQLVQASQEKPEIWVYVRGDRKAHFESIFSVIDMCVQNGITRVSFRTKPNDNAAESP